MSGERLTTPDEATVLKAGIDACVDELERMGFSRDEIGAAMTGVGIALVQIHNGHEKALSCLASARVALVAEAQGRQ